MIEGISASTVEFLLTDLFQTFLFESKSNPESDIVCKFGTQSLLGMSILYKLFLSGFRKSK